MRVDTTFRSRVARRIFLLFVMCALLPLGVQAWLSWGKVSGQLARQAEERLMADANAAAMTLVERVQSIDSDLSAIDAGLRAGVDLAEASRGKEARLAQRLVGLALVGEGGRLLDKLQLSIEIPAWSSDERAFLESGHTLLAVRENPSGFAHVLLARATVAPGGASAVLLGRIEPRFLWAESSIERTETELFVLDEHGQVLFSTLPDRTPVQTLAAAARTRSASGSFAWSLDGEEAAGSYRTLFMRPQYLAVWTVARGRSRADILAPVASFQRDFLLVTALTFWLVLMASARQIRRSLVPIGALIEATRRVAAREFGPRVQIETGDEFEELGESFNRMTESLEQHLEVQRGLHRIGVALTAENDSERLIDTVLSGAQQILGVEAAAFFELEDDRVILRACREGEALVMTGELLSEVEDPYCLAALAVQRGRPVLVKDFATATGHEVEIDREIDRAREGSTRSLLALPLCDHEGEILGVLQVMDPVGENAVFDEERCRLAESIAAQAAVALSKNDLVQAFRQLFVSVSELIATAVDQKSPYTAAHCRRVPVLTMMLADSACAATEGPFADYELSPEERFEVEVAALLHDCGKIVTPVHVVDKSTKLETLFDRIRLVDTRFEVLRRDAEIELLRDALARAGGDPRSPELAARLQERVDAILEDRDFVRHANIGCERMPETDQQRVRDIAARYTWVDPDGDAMPFLDEDELANLCIERGTLTPEERQIINDHIVVTIKMLEQIEYPRSLRKVPELAGAHHERMDGRGFPCGLTRDEILLPGRMMGIADIFEALTDPDRPYKEGKSLQESLEILGCMAVEGHVDPDLFQLFIDDEIYLRYAQQFMRPEQIGTVDLSRVPGYVPPEHARRKAS